MSSNHQENENYGQETHIRHKVSISSFHENSVPKMKYIAMLWNLALRAGQAP